MRGVIQRVSMSDVAVDGITVGRCGRGLLVLLGVAKGDTEEDADVLAAKISRLRIFEDENGKMNLSVKDIEGELLVISNFTLCADCRHGNRPDFFGAEVASRAEGLYEYFFEKIKSESGCHAEKGIFGADMSVKLENDGPVTVVIDSSDLKKRTEK